MQLRLTPRVDLYTQSFYNRAAATMYGLNYDPNVLAGPTPGLDWTLMSENFASFSDLRIRYFTQSLGANLALSERLMLNAGLEYHKYDDRDPYLFDTSGTRLTSFVGLSWLW